MATLKFRLLKNLQNTGYGGYGAPDTGYGAPSSGYGAPSSGYSAPAAGYSSRNDLVSALGFRFKMQCRQWKLSIGKSYLTSSELKNTKSTNGSYCVCVFFFFVLVKSTPITCGTTGWTDPWTESSLPGADPTPGAAQISPGRRAQAEAAHCLPGA